MASQYAKLRAESTLGSTNTARLSDFDETDPYYFVAKENGKVIAEGELTRIKLDIPDGYLYKPIKKFYRDRTTMVCTIEY